MARKKSSKPLFRIKAPLKATAYRGVFRPFAATQYLNIAAIKAAKRKVAIECGTVEANGISVTLVAEVKKGEIVALRPSACVGCRDFKGKARKASPLALTRTMQEVRRRLDDRGLTAPVLPIPLKVQARAINIPLGPIVITIGDLGDDGFDCCITIYIPGFNICWCCVVNGCHCYAIP